uniref:FYVE-type domain-containing protein n=1 Tax=Arcella intermedia TaxID=1963864 RepID=A0A6B2L4S6_9EUKA
MEEFTSIVEQIKQLTNSIHFVLWTKDSDGVDNPRYWEITPRFIEEKTNVMFVSPNVSELELAKRELARQTKLSNRTSNSTPIPPQPTKETLPPSAPKPEVKVEPVTEIVVSSPRSSNPRSPPLSPSSGPQRSESPAPAQIEAAPALPELGEEEAKWLEKQQRTLEMLHTLTDFTLVALPIEQPPSAGGAKPKTKRKAKIANIDNPDEQGGLPADPQTSPVSPDEEDLNVKKTHHLSLEFLPNHFPQMPHPSKAYNSPHQSLPPPIKKSPSEENLHSNHRSPEKPRTLGKEIERMQRDQNRNTKVKTKLLNQNVKAIKTLETEQKLNRILSDDEQVNEKFDQILQKHELSSKKFKKPTWQNDREVTKCSDCTKPFSVVRRKHHCRCCGKIYCAECCSHKRTLPPHMGYTSPQLACNSCIYQHSL